MGEQHNGRSCNRDYLGVDSFVCYPSNWDLGQSCKKLWPCITSRRQSTVSVMVILYSSNFRCSDCSWSMESGTATSKLKFFVIRPLPYTFIPYVFLFPNALLYSQ